MLLIGGKIIRGFVMLGAVKHLMILLEITNRKT